jgi:16S rRNA (cytidine1402-2'-O)-methyltransferase
VEAFRVVGIGTSCHHRVVAGTLFLVGTPIGNLGDITDRARETLASADVVAAEDTRRTGRLLATLGIRRRLVSFFEGNERERTEELLARLRDGATVAVVSDGGMPGVSDPGFRLVRASVEEGIDVRVVPGPSAAIAALVVSGLPADRFAFEGFLPRRRAERRRRLEQSATDPRTLVVFESPRRVAALLRDVVDVLGDRPVAMCRELTKLHEEVVRGSASEVLARVSQTQPKGEVVIVLGGSTSRSGDVAAAVDEAREMVSSGARPREAARAAAARHALSANDVYRMLVASGD